jgi:exonuclease III
MLFLQEVKIALKDRKTQDAVQNAVNTPLPFERVSRGLKYDVHFTLPNDPHNARGLCGNGKLYSVCSIIRSDISSTLNLTPEVRTVGWDKEGRISIVHLTSTTPTANSPLNLALNLAFINTYAPNGTSNPYHSPLTETILGTRHDRKLTFHKLLIEECLRLEKEGWQIVIAGDMNRWRRRDDN